MKITYTNQSAPRVIATVWHNGEAHTLHDNDSIDLDVHRGDQVEYRVGRMTRRTPIHFQATDAKFVIEADRVFQMIFFGIIFALILLAYVLHWLDNYFVALAGIIIMVVAYEGIVFFRGFRARPVH